MRTRDHADTAAAILLVAVAVLFRWSGDAPAPEALRTAAAPALPPPGSNARERFEWCRENVAIIHDLYWASACAGSADDSADCMLPDNRARTLNEARARAEQQCLVDATAHLP